MAVKDPKELFVMMLSDLRRGAERSTNIYQELSGIAQDSDVKEILAARAFVADGIQKKLDECFRIIGAQPTKLEGKLHDVFVEDFRRELAEIQSPEVRRLFVLAKLIRLIRFRTGEYEALIAAADLTGHYAVGVLLETCLAEKIALLDRARRLIRERVEERVAERVASAVR